MWEGLRTDLVRLHGHHRSGQGEHYLPPQIRCYQTVCFAEEGSQGDGHDEVTQHGQSGHGGPAGYVDSQGERERENLI